ncbi:hypothetical protein BDV95DRAFT_623837 [Massariosphaeria phaeospora]|uniref:F-box domain-containing protein n=1 Tax=Massariosphaeria phaeospora TaxID=100035 RepID=A0A7C8I1A0_9PLEO|nr:hypothetical protein BDV95DRAFT_623837 [Massariosphaeria phaeospora]
MSIMAPTLGYCPADSAFLLEQYKQPKFTSAPFDLENLPAELVLEIIEQHVLEQLSRLDFNPLLKSRRVCRTFNREIQRVLHKHVMIPMLQNTIRPCNPYCAQLLHEVTASGQYNSVLADTATSPPQGAAETIVRPIKTCVTIAWDLDIGTRSWPDLADELRKFLCATVSVSARFHELLRKSAWDPTEEHFSRIALISRTLHYLYSRHCETEAKRSVSKYIATLDDPLTSAIHDAQTTLVNCLLHGSTSFPDCIVQTLLEEVGKQGTSGETLLRLLVQALPLNNPFIISPVVSRAIQRGDPDCIESVFTVAGTGYPVQTGQHPET